MSSAHPAVSIIVPAYREAANMEALIERVFAATSQAGIEAELIIVDDDSRDGTEEIVKSLSRDYPVRIIVRYGQRSLAGAVIEGFRSAVHDRFVVLDADLQHPPEAIPDLIGRLEQGDCDFAIATRYAAGARVDTDWPLLRRLRSRVATCLASPLASLSDPMSGFFAVHRRTWEEAAEVDPIGYKIALEIYVKGRCSRPAEVPITFATRAAGSSKLSLRQQLQYLGHLGRLYRFRFPRASMALGALLALVGVTVTVMFVCKWRAGQVDCRLLME